MNRWRPALFSKALQTDDVRALVNHNPDMVLGRNRCGTLTLSEDEKGLYFEVVAPNAQWAMDLHESVKRRDINQCSFGFTCLRDEWRTANGKDERTRPAYSGRGFFVFGLFSFTFILSDFEFNTPARLLGGMM